MIGSSSSSLELLKIMKLAVVLIFFCFYALINEAISTTTTKHYIVYMGEHSESDLNSLISSNHEMLAPIIGSYRQAEEATVHHYTKSFRGFSAILTPEQAQQLSEMESVISVFESRMNQVHTTRSWDFLRINDIPQYNQLPTEAKTDVIVGVIDSGIWPGPSFSDKGLGPVPKRFKGKCDFGDDFYCDRKIIGARFYSKGYEAERYGTLESYFNQPSSRSARDTIGHGTHCASTIAGSVVNNVSYLGLAAGTARGGMPSARLAIYKACWFDGCSDADVLSAIDDAIHDGVDIISISISESPAPESLSKDFYAIGSFHAFKKGILVSASAGNDGFPSTAVNTAPWILTVAASSIDREFNSKVSLGNNSKGLQGSALSNNGPEMDEYYDIIAASEAAAANVSVQIASFCKAKTLDNKLIEGKIVVCTIDENLSSSEDISKEIAEKANAILDGHGVGMILIAPKDYGLQLINIRAILIGQEEAKVLLEYLATDKPVAKFHQTMTVISKTSPAPKMAYFSSMGPSRVNPQVIKPDITAPGVNILAAWSESPLATVGAGLSYNIISGTSMACPHISAIAAIVKSYHPSWSPAAIKSAIMTTASVLDNTGKPIKDSSGSPATPFNYGSGHVNAKAALDPGLVYDFDSDDIINFLCSNGFIKTCNNPSIPSYDLNYPSIAVTNMTGSVLVQRTVTYYGKGPTVFTASMEKPTGVEVTVTPDKLEFKEAEEKMSFNVTFTPYDTRITRNRRYVFGSITWSNGKHKVRSPIALNVVSVI